MNPSGWIRYCCFLALTVTLLAPGGERARAVAPDGESYTYGFWPTNPRRVRQAQDYRFAVQTSQYGLLLNVQHATLERLGALAQPLSARQALEGTNGWLDSLPAGGPAFWLNIGGRRYHIVSAGINPLERRNIIWRSLRLIGGGRYLQHFEVINLQFADDQGRPFEGLLGSAIFHSPFAALRGPGHSGWKLNVTGNGPPWIPRVKERSSVRPIMIRKTAHTASVTLWICKPRKPICALE